MTLLTGKSPVVIDPKCDLEVAARRILWGKIANAGQTCVAPDYVLVPRHFQDKFAQALKDAYENFYPASARADAEQTFSRLITPAAFSRVHGLLKSTKGEIVFGGGADESTKYIEPTIVKNVSGDDSLMSEEIFGPVLPIVPVDDVDEAVKFIKARDHPLALYVFSPDAAFKAKVFDNTQSGSAVANETIIIPGVEGLPFGGIGPSGSGYHTGKYTFDMFTHLRASIDTPNWVDKILSLRYPPYTPAKLNRVRKAFFPSLPARPTGPPLGGASNKRWGRWFFIAVALTLAGVLTKRPKGLSL
ncbi:hypothetical protein HGRIS_011462 [Hohenbuehelia grisea]|uniref:Aldehyde dehydrogenase domain-containing protein n=1 Tax=Hohenbuehelia grisea TaxID=104357 RepID=A0ABR3JVD3_9AGAR